MMSDNALEEARAEAIEQDRAYSRARLKRELRMKPAPNAEPISHVRNAFKTLCSIYRVADCVPMKAASQKQSEPSAKQIENRRRFAQKAYLTSRSGKAGTRVSEWMEADPVFLDTETTGLDHHDEIVEIAITDASGSVLFESYCRPTVPVSEGAFDVHGIGAEVLEQAPSWLEISDQVKAVLQDKLVVIFNAGFDVPIIRQTQRANGDDDEFPIHSRCAMYAAADFLGPTNKYGTISLVNAAAAAGVEFQGKAHSAAGDAATTAGLIAKIAMVHEEKLTKL
ncbi:3'-5' exonuclease [Halospina sp. K52047b]|uniref:3'-5' exonuclease n=1 Tax=Halospina sp. K52047b TaxID=2614160 RepID=UPI001788170B|nr:3'-5' exonuclease [Halospina sp. K52047b]